MEKELKTKIYEMPIGDVVSMTKEELLEYVEMTTEASEFISSSETKTYYFIHAGKVFFSGAQESLLIPLSLEDKSILGNEVYTECGTIVKLEKMFNDIIYMKEVIKTRLQLELNVLIEITDTKSLKSFETELKIVKKMIKYYNTMKKIED
jgi:hypothetical protein